MFGLAIVAVGLLFLAFSLTYKCVMARKQRQREAAEVRLPRPDIHPDLNSSCQFDRLLCLCKRIA